MVKPGKGKVISMKYDAMIEPTPTGWSGFVVGLPAYGTGRTIEETIQDLANVAEFCVEQLSLHGEPIPPPARYQGPPLEPGGRILPQAITVDIPALTG